MAGLEVLYESAAPSITCTQDALVCFLHWEVVTHGYYGLGTGDQPGPSDKKSELLPAGWNNSKDLYVLRYESKDGSRKLLVKAITMETSMIINVLEYGSQQVADLTLNLDDYISAEDLHDFHRCDPLGPFAVGGEDLDPFGCRRGGMVVDPLRSGFPRALIDPSSGLPNRLPPGAVPPGARFDPFGPIGTSPSGPNPDHLPPPGFDDMYL
uniref:Proteasome inhibitor PI31 subunit n=1 Tax=Urocitellus parryii TaxID=9999 RepID=A0A8D2IA88_UROPR